MGRFMREVEDAVKQYKAASSSKRSTRRIVPDSLQLKFLNLTITKTDIDEMVSRLDSEFFLSGGTPPIHMAFPYCKLNGDQRAISALENFLATRTIESLRFSLTHFESTEIQRLLVASKDTLKTLHVTLRFKDTIGPFLRVLGSHQDESNFLPLQELKLDARHPTETKVRLARMLELSAALPALQSNHLKSFQLTNCEFDDAGFAVLVGGLLALQNTLQNVRIQNLNANMSPSSLAFIANLMSDFPCLKFLHVDITNGNDKRKLFHGAKEEQIIPFATAIQNCPASLRLGFYNTGIETSMAITFFQVAADTKSSNFSLIIEDSGFLSHSDTMWLKRLTLYLPKMKKCAELALSDFGHYMESSHHYEDVILTALERNTSLEEFSLRLGESVLFQTQRTRLDAILHRNVNIGHIQQFLLKTKAGNFPDGLWPFVLAKIAKSGDISPSFLAIRRQGYNWISQTRSTPATTQSTLAKNLAANQLGTPRDSSFQSHSDGSFRAPRPPKRHTSEEFWKCIQDALNNLDESSDTESSDDSGWNTPSGSSEGTPLSPNRSMHSQSSNNSQLYLHSHADAPAAIDSPTANGISNYDVAARDVVHGKEADSSQRKISTDVDDAKRLHGKVADLSEEKMSTAVNGVTDPNSVPGKEADLFEKKKGSTVNDVIDSKRVHGKEADLLERNKSTSVDDVPLQKSAHGKEADSSERKKSSTVNDVPLRISAHGKEADSSERKKRTAVNDVPLRKSAHGKEADSSERKKRTTDDAPVRKSARGADLSELKKSTAVYDDVVPADVVPAAKRGDGEESDSSQPEKGKKKKPSKGDKTHKKERKAKVEKKKIKSDSKKSLKKSPQKDEVIDSVKKSQSKLTELLAQIPEEIVIDELASDASELESPNLSLSNARKKIDPKAVESEVSVSILEQQPKSSFDMWTKDFLVEPPLDMPLDLEELANENDQSAAIGADSKNAVDQSNRKEKGNGGDAVLVKDESKDAAKKKSKPPSRNHDKHAGDGAKHLDHNKKHHREKKEVADDEKNASLKNITVDAVEHPPDEGMKNAQNHNSKKSKDKVRHAHHASFKEKESSKKHEKQQGSSSNGLSLDEEAHDAVHSSDTKKVSKKSKGGKKMHHQELSSPKRTEHDSDLIENGNDVGHVEVHGADKQESPGKSPEHVKDSSMISKMFSGVTAALSSPRVSTAGRKSAAPRMIASPRMFASPRMVKAASSTVVHEKTNVPDVTAAPTSPSGITPLTVKAANNEKANVPGVTTARTSARRMSATPQIVASPDIVKAANNTVSREKTNSKASRRRTMRT